MPCTTILAGRKATYDGSTMIARNEDSGAGSYGPKKFTVVKPDDQPRSYTSTISHVSIELPDNPMRYTAMPNAVYEDEGIWAAAGVNEANVAMTATETITSNERVLAADPMVVYVPEDKKKGTPETPGGIGEEDIVTITLPYIRSAREGVLRLGALLEQYGTYEMNGIAFQDVNEIWWLETIGGHHWIARRVPDDAYVVAPNQFGIDYFDLEDAFGAKEEFLCSADLREFVRDNHLDLALFDELDEAVLSEVLGDQDEADLSGFLENRNEAGEDLEGDKLSEAARLAVGFDARAAFGSHSDADHVYNTPRAWYGQRYFNPSDAWEGPDAEWCPTSDDLPWCRVPEKKITVDDIKYVLSSHYNGTPYDPYAKYGDGAMKGAYRSIGVNRTNFLSLTQIRPYLPEKIRTIEWVAFGANPFNAFVPFYTQVEETPDYFANTDHRVTTENFYWANRILGALADAQYGASRSHIERYQIAVLTKGLEMILKADKAYLASQAGAGKTEPFSAEKINREISDMVKEKTEDTLLKVLNEVSNRMKCAYARSDA